MIEHYIILLSFIIISLIIMIFVQGVNSSFFIIKRIFGMFTDYFVSFLNRYCFSKLTLTKILLLLSFFWFIAGWTLQIQLKGINTIKSEIKGDTPDKHVNACFEYMNYLSQDLHSQTSNKNITRKILNKYLKQNCYDCFYGGKYSFNRKGYLVCSKHGTFKNSQKAAYAN